MLKSCFRFENYYYVKYPNFVSNKPKLYNVGDKVRFVQEKIKEIPETEKLMVEELIAQLELLKNKNEMISGTREYIVTFVYPTSEDNENYIRIKNSYSENDDIFFLFNEKLFVLTK